MDKVDRNGVMANVPQAAAVPWLEEAPAAEARWTGEGGWDGRSMAASQGLEPTLLQERMGEQCWFSLEKGRLPANKHTWWRGGGGGGRIAPALLSVPFCTRAGTHDLLSTQTAGSPWFQVHRLTLLEH